MALDSYDKYKRKRGKVLRIRLKEEQYKLFVQFCKSQNTTPVRLIKKGIKDSLMEFSCLKDEGLIPEENQLLLFDDENEDDPSLVKSDKLSRSDEDQLKLF
ncbi:MAG: hypothetical protein ACEPOW_11760 [Bacteroidales bacterium]